VKKIKALYEEQLYAVQTEKLAAGCGVGQECLISPVLIAILET